MGPAASRRKPVVLVADRLSDEGLLCLRANGIEPAVETGLSDAKLKARLAKVEGVVVRSATKLTAKVLPAGRSKLRVIGRAGIGVDNIDVARATELGLAVLNTPDANATTTAELAIAHIFGCARRLAAADASVRAGEWDRAKYTGTEIAGKTAGVLGYGTIGRIVAQRCRGLGLKVMVHDPFVPAGVVEEDGCEAATLKKLLAGSDFVTIHTPGGKATEGLIGRRELALMKSTAYLIQCARGGIVAEEDLALALNKGGIAGAAVDVFTAEPLPAGHVLRGARNIAFTPHLGASTKEAQRATGLAIAEQLGQFFRSGEAVNAVNLPRVPGDVLDVTRPYLPLAKNLGLLLAASCSLNPRQLTMALQGEAAELPESVVLAEAVSGLLGGRLSFPVNQVNAAAVAERQGLKLAVEKSAASREFATMLRLRLRCGREEVEVAGTLLGGDQPRIAYFDGIELEAPLTGPALLTTHHDRPGVIAEITALLAELKINITHMHVGSAGKRAAAFIRMARPLPDRYVAQVRRLRNVKSAVSMEFGA